MRNPALPVYSEGSVRCGFTAAPNQIGKPALVVQEKIEVNEGTVLLRQGCAGKETADCM
jgi:hypothetical protein